MCEPTSSSISSQAKVSPMKLSTAIRLGSMLRPQGFGSYLDHDDRTCAFGAAFDAIGILMEMATLRVDQNWPWCQRMEMECPACRQKQGIVEGLVVHLNDYHQWTRERIADWVATIEPQDVPAPAVELAQSVVAEVAVLVG